MKLSKRTIEILNAYGWTPERKVDTAIFEERLKREGYVIFESAIRFLSNFGGLYLKVPQYRGQGLEMLHFDPIRTSDDVYIENIKSYEERVGEKLLPIGEAYNGYFVLMISESGKVFGAFDDTLRLEGHDYEEAIETLYRCLETPEIP